MSREVEIEFKSMLTKEEYDQLLKEYGGDTPSLWKQENFYADTQDFALKEQGSALRIRRLPNKNECTLKTPYGEHLLETTFLLSNDDADRMIKQNRLDLSQEILNELTKMAIDPSHLRFFADLSTIRFEKKEGNQLVVLDKSFYSGTVDYELEVEAVEAKEGRAFFEQLLKEHGIPYRKAKNKIKRAMDQSNL